MKDIERMVISAHADGEVESPWKEQVEQRMADDPRWADEASLHHRVKAALATSPEPDFGAAQARVWARLNQAPRASHPFHPLPLVWTSVAAATLLVVAAGAGFWVGRQSATPHPGAVEVSELQVQVPKQLELKLTGEGQLLMASTLQRMSP